MQESWKELLEAIETLGCEPWLGRTNWGKVSKHLGITKNAAKNRYQRFAKWTAKNGQTLGNGQSLDDLLKTVSGNWQVSTVSLGSSGGKQRISASLRPKKEVLDTDRIIAAVSKISPPKMTPLNREKGEFLFVPNLYDVHLEKATITNESVEEIVDLYKYILNSMLSLVTSFNYPISKIMLPFGHDFGNFDTLAGTTTKGTPQQNSVSMETAINARCDLAASAVSLCASVAPTDVVMVQGNHDVVSNWWLGKYLSAYFRNSDHVKVDDTMLPRKYYRYGDVLFMLTHEIKKEPVSLFATEAKREWSNARFGEVLTGHLHSRMTNEQYGVLVRRFPSLSRTDRWHNDEGYVGNKIGGIGLVYSKQRGVVAEYPFLYD